MKYIELSKHGWKNKGKYFAIIDSADYEKTNKYKWTVCVTKYTQYAYATINNKKIPMHRFILNCDNIVDHINGNGLDNRKHNLRLCTVMENNRNKQLYNSATKYKGVHYQEVKRNDKTYFYIKSRIIVDKKQIYLGQFKNIIDAAIAYDKAAIKYFGEFARLNFPEL